MSESSKRNAKGALGIEAKGQNKYREKKQGNNHHKKKIINF